MAGISKAAGLSRVYTYNCIKGTYASVLDELPVSPPVSLVTPKLRQILPRGCITSTQSLPTMVPLSNVASGFTESQALSGVVTMTTVPNVVRGVLFVMVLLADLLLSLGICVRVCVCVCVCVYNVSCYKNKGASSFEPEISVYSCDVIAVHEMTTEHPQQIKFYFFMLSFCS